MAVDLHAEAPTHIQLMPLPRWVEPQLSKLVEKAPTGPNWVHEIKFDGYRMAARIERGKVQLLTRSGLDWTEKYPATTAAFAKLSATTAYIDGELCGVRADGVTSFELMQQSADAGVGCLWSKLLRRSPRRQRSARRCKPSAASGPGRRARSAGPVS